MKKKINLTAIIAVTMIAMSVLVLGSCNADDDDYNFEYGTLAKGMMTRSGMEGDIPPAEDFYRSNECGIWCILYLLGKASQYTEYSHAVDSALSIGWDDDGPLYGDQMENLGNKLGIEFSGWKSNTDINGEITNDATTTLDLLLSDNERYGTNGKLQNVIISIKSYRNGTMYPHYVVVKKQDEKNPNKIWVYDVNAPENHLTSVSKNNILGVIY